MSEEQGQEQRQGSSFPLTWGTWDIASSSGLPFSVFSFPGERAAAINVRPLGQEDERNIPRYESPRPDNMPGLPNMNAPQLPQQPSPQGPQPGNPRAQNPYFPAGGNGGYSVLQGSWADPNLLALFGFLHAQNVLAHIDNNSTYGLLHSNNTLASIDNIRRNIIEALVLSNPEALRKWAELRADTYKPLSEEGEGASESIVEGIREVSEESTSQEVSERDEILQRIRRQILRYSRLMSQTKSGKLKDEYRRRIEKLAEYESKLLRGEIPEFINQVRWYSSIAYLNDIVARNLENMGARRAHDAGNEMAKIIAATEELEKAGYSLDTDLIKYVIGRKSRLPKKYQQDLEKLERIREKVMGMNSYNLATRIATKGYGDIEKAAGVVSEIYGINADNAQKVVGIYTRGLIRRGRGILHYSPFNPTTNQ